MTRKEAIEILKRNKPTSDPRRCGTELCEAVDMAIAALQEPEIVHCKDCKYWIRTRIGEEELNQCGLAGYLIGGRGYCLYGKKAGDQE